MQDLELYGPHSPSPCTETTRVNRTVCRPNSVVKLCVLIFREEKSLSYFAGYIAGGLCEALSLSSYCCEFGPTLDKWMIYIIGDAPILCK